jgi:hypothetical protein
MFPSNRRRDRGLFRGGRSPGTLLTTAMPRRSRRRVPIALLTICLAVLGCVPYTYNVKPGTAPRCADGVCFEIVTVSESMDVIGAWIDSPAAARLLNAHVAFDRDLPCGVGVPVTWVRVGPSVYRSGPADVVGHSGLAFGFPPGTWRAHDHDWTESFLDLNLDVAGQPRCVRAGLLRAGRRRAVGP